MNTPTYDKGITALLVVDPDNDFISEGGKIWPHIKAVAEADQSDEMMHAALEVNMPNYAGAIASTEEIVAAIATL